MMVFSEKTDPEYTLRQASQNLRNRGCPIYYKSLQEVHTELKLILIGAPNYMRTEDIVAAFMTELKLIKKRS